MESLKYINKEIHFVLVSVPFEIDPQEYEKVIKKSGVSYTLITEFTRTLPPALCQHEKCRILVCPSRGEPFSNIPMEAAVWGKDGGAIVLASDVDGFLEQISDGKNGFHFRCGDAKSLGKKINEILDLSQGKLTQIRRNAYRKVVKERGFKQNFTMLLDSVWE